MMLLNCGVGEDSRESLDYKEIQLVNVKEINPEYSLEGLRLKLKLQCFGHLMQKASSLAFGKDCWERLRAGREGGDRQ